MPLFLVPGNWLNHLYNSKNMRITRIYHYQLLFTFEFYSYDCVVEFIIYSYYHLTSISFFNEMDDFPNGFNHLLSSFSFNFNPFGVNFHDLPSAELT